MTIDILCKVVDNYGDIGVVYRLARALSQLDPFLTLRLVVDDLFAFSMLEPLVCPRLAVQNVRGWTVVDWKGPDEVNGNCYERVYGQASPEVVLECFACGRPDWFEAMLFSPGASSIRTIVNLEYLSAEPFADEFHQMPSLTRSEFVRKHIFMPGFTGNTGGLILDGAFMRLRSDYDNPEEITVKRPLLLTALGCAQAFATEESAKSYWILVFGYERNYSRIVEDIREFGRTRPVLVLVASGKSGPCFIDAWERAGRPFRIVSMPFLPQETWDEALLSCDFLIVRGEDSMARAALSGKPFLWHAYPQSEKHQMVKVRALLERMRPFFDRADFEPLESAFLAFNDRLADDTEVLGCECITPFLDAGIRIRQGFSSFSKTLIAHGNLAANLMTFIRKVV